jgi:long-chain acyl-CoA synthetase
MKTFTTPGEVAVAAGDNAVAALLRRAAEHGDEPALAHRDGDGFVDVSASEFAAMVKDVAAGLVALGIQPGSRIALFCSTRIEFTLLDYAIWAAGCATTTIYETSSAEQVEWIIGDSGSVAILCENQDTWGVFEEVAQSVPDCGHGFVIEQGAVDHLRGLATDDSRAEVDRRIAALNHDDLATLVYTSGTTGRPKGCVITHGNFTWLFRQTEQSLGDLLGPEYRQLMFLPLAHIFARVVQVVCVSSGTKIGYSSGIPNLMQELPMFRPTWVFSVPRVFEKIYNGAKQRADADGKGKIFDRAAAVAIAYSQGMQEGKVGVFTRLQHAVFDRLVYVKLRRAVGGELARAISGGAALGARLGHFFSGVGITVLEGYGLTETTAGATVNTPDAIRIGSVGRPIPGVTIGIAHDGEVLIRGGNVFSGYWNNEPATREAIDADGWFHSGDVGELDGDGFLSITGRKKELIVTAGGKNVAPAVLEDRIRAHALVSQVMVIGDSRPFIAALVSIDEESLPGWAAANEKPSAALADLVDDPDLLAAIAQAIDDGNKAVSKAEAIKAWRIMPEDLTIAGGELTPTLKVRRDIVAKKYENLITEIYG